ncbi:DNA transfer protein [Erwinia sp. P6884]|uniref:DNA transfer protein n=1 Tax=Erwinia sp. P6884 TaxID=3141450 RepID=UPI003189D959
MFYAMKLGRKLRREEPLYPEGGGGKGGDNGAGAQADAMNKSTELQKQQWQTVMNNLAPFTPLAQQYVSQLQGLSSLEGQNSALNSYYGSDQYKQLANQARYQSLAGAEATGGLGSTATSNQLATIAPTLGQNWLSGQMQNSQNLANIGLGALQGQANAGQTYANNAGALYQQQANLAAANSNQPSGFSSAISGGMGGASTGMSLGGPWGAAIGGGLGILGSLF